MELKGHSDEVSSEGDDIDQNYEPFQFPEIDRPPSPDLQLEPQTVNFLDVEDPQQLPLFKKSFPGSVAKVLGVGRTVFEKLRLDQVSFGENEWAPFASAEEWDLSRWLLTNTSQNAIDQFLKLPIVSQ
jgi:hypothetical protein